MRAALYHRTTMADWPCKPQENLANLRRFAELREWDVALDLDEALERHDDKKPLLEQLSRGIAAGDVDVVVVESLWRLFSGPLHFARAAHLWVLEKGVAIVTVVEMLDTTRPDGSPRLRDAIQLYSSIIEGWQAEATRVGMIAARRRRPGNRLSVPVNRLELKALLERGYRNRWLSQREIVEHIVKGGGRLSRGRLQAEIQAMREAGELDDAAREQMRLRTGRPSRGQRAKPLIYDAAEIAELARRGLSRKRILESAESLPKTATEYYVKRVLRDMAVRETVREMSGAAAGAVA